MLWRASIAGIIGLALGLWAVHRTARQQETTHMLLATRKHTAMMRTHTGNSAPTSQADQSKIERQLRTKPALSLTAQTPQHRTPPAPPSRPRTG